MKPVKILRYTGAIRRINKLIDPQRLNTEALINMELSPYWITGFVDGEGTFYVGINRNSTMAAGYQVLPEFRIVQHERDIKVLYALKQFFGCGVVRVNHDTRYELRIRSTEHLKNIIIPFFERHNLMTQKKFDFLKFKKIIRLMEEKKHLTISGIEEIIGIACKMNRQNKQKTLDNFQAGQDKVHA